MKYKASAHVLRFDGKPITGSDQNPAKFSELVQLVFMVAKPHDKAEDKLRVDSILRRSHNADDLIELSSEDVNLVKQAALGQADAIYGALHEFLENPTADMKEAEQ